MPVLFMTKQIDRSGGAKIKNSNFAHNHGLILRIQKSEKYKNEERERMPLEFSKAACPDRLHPLSVPAPSLEAFE